MTTMIKKNRRGIALFLVFTFFYFIHLSAFPARAEVRQPVNGTGMTNDHDNPAAVEQAGQSRRVEKKKSILPVILITVGVLGAAAVLYFLVLKKSEKLHDDFESAADAKWQPRHSSYWSVAGGVYKCDVNQSNDPNNWWEWNLYNRSWTKPDYTITAKMRITGNSTAYGVILCSSTDMSSSSTYQFMLIGDGRYKLRMFTEFNYTNSTLDSGGTQQLFKDWTASSAIQNFGSWNTIKIVKTGGTYTLSVNGTQVDSFTDTTFDPRYVGIFGHTQIGNVHLEVDSFYVDLN